MGHVSVLFEGVRSFALSLSLGELLLLLLLMLLLLLWLLLLLLLLLLLTVGRLANLHALTTACWVFSGFRFNDSFFVPAAVLGGLPSFPNFVSLDCTHCTRFLTTCCRALGNVLQAEG